MNAKVVSKFGTLWAMTQLQAAAALALLALPACASTATTGAELCRDLSLAAPRCGFDPDGCEWSPDDVCHPARADDCVRRMEATFEASGGACTADVILVRLNCDACVAGP